MYGGSSNKLELKNGKTFGCQRKVMALIKSLTKVVIKEDSAT
jgi:hypothetical protein